VIQGRARPAVGFDTQARDEQSFYRTLGLSSKLLYVPAAMMKPLCAARQAGLPEDDAQRYGIGWESSAWIPTRDQLESFGVHDVAGWWPAPAELADTLRRVGFNARFRPVYGAAPAAIADPGAFTGKPLPACRGAAER
jgi:hypothetical protein